VIRPAKLWNDTSTIVECDRLIKTLGGVKKVVGLIGNNILPGFTAGKILWMKNHEPLNYSKLKTVLLPHNYINYWLTGELTMEAGDASGTALMNIRNRQWSREIVDSIDPRLIEKLPIIRPSNEPVGLLTIESAKKLGLDDEILVSSGGGDNMMAAIGTGNTKEGVFTLSLGTSGTIYSYSSVPRIDPLGEVHAFCDSTGAWLPLVCTMNATGATELVKKLFKVSHKELENRIKSSPPGSDGLMMLPYLTGERTPSIPNGKGVLYGLTPQTFTSQHISRSAMEGVTLGLNYGLNKIKKIGIEPTEVRITGGGAKNSVWRQIVSDVFNSEVVCLEFDEGAAYGAAIQALWTYRSSLGEKAEISKFTDEFVKLDETTRVVPNPTNSILYSKLQVVHNRLSKILARTFDEQL
jgi:D-xylulose kinase